MNRDPFGLGPLLYGFAPAAVSPAGPGWLLAAGATSMVLIPDGHDGCSISTFCRNPLHPGPCKGWKKNLGMQAPGALNAIEAARKAKVAAKRAATGEAKSAASKNLSRRQLASPLHAKKATIKSANVLLGHDEGKASAKADKVILNKTEIKKYSQIKAAQVASIGEKHDIPPDMAFQADLADALAKDNVGGKDTNYQALIGVHAKEMGAILADKLCKEHDGDCDGKLKEGLADELGAAFHAALLDGDDTDVDKIAKDFEDGKFQPPKAAEPEPPASAAPDSAPAKITGKATANKVSVGDTVQSDGSSGWEVPKGTSVKVGKVDKSKSTASNKTYVTLHDEDGKQVWTGSPNSKVNTDAPDAPSAAKSTPPPLEGNAAAADKGMKFGLGLSALMKGNKTLGTKAQQKDFADKLQAEMDDPEGPKKGVTKHGADALAGTLLTKASNATMTKPFMSMSKGEKTKIAGLLGDEIEQGLKGGDGPTPTLDAIKEGLAAQANYDFQGVQAAKAKLDEQVKQVAAKMLGVDPNAPSHVVAAHVLFKPGVGSGDGKDSTRLLVLNAMTNEEFGDLPLEQREEIKKWLEDRALSSELSGGDEGKLQMDEIVGLQQKLGLPAHQPADEEPDVLQGLIDAVPEATGAPDLHEMFGPDGNPDHGQAVDAVNGMTKKEWDDLAPDEQINVEDHIQDAVQNGEPGAAAAKAKLDAYTAVLADPGPPAAIAFTSPDAKKASNYATGVTAGTAKQKLAAYEKVTGDEFAQLTPAEQKLILADLDAIGSKFLDPKKKQQAKAHKDYLSGHTGGGSGAGGAPDATAPPSASDADKVAAGKALFAEMTNLIDSVPDKQKAIDAATAVLAEGVKNGSHDGIATAMADFQAGLALKALSEQHMDPLGASLIDPDAVAEIKPKLAEDLVKKLKGEGGSTPIYDAWKKAMQTGSEDDAQAVADAATGFNAGVAGAPVGVPATPGEKQQLKLNVGMAWLDAGFNNMPSGAPPASGISNIAEDALADGVGSPKHVQWAKEESELLAAETFDSAYAHMQWNPDQIGAMPNPLVHSVIKALEADYQARLLDTGAWKPSTLVQDMEDAATDTLAEAKKTGKANGWPASSTALKSFETALFQAKLEEIVKNHGTPAGAGSGGAPNPGSSSVPGLPTTSTPPLPAVAPSTPFVPAPIGTGSGIANIPFDKQQAILEDLKGFTTGKFLSDPEEATYGNLLVLAAVHGTPADPISVLQALQSVDNALSSKLGVANTNLWEQKFTDWLKTPAGAKFAKANPTPDANLVKKLTGVYDGVTTDLAELAKKVPLLPGPGAFDENKPSSDFKIASVTDGNKWRAQMLASQGGSFTPAQQSGITTYTGSSYGSMNSWLRGKTSSIDSYHKTAIKNTQDAMRPLPADTMLIRGTGWDALPEGFRSPTGAKKLIGQTVMDEAFMSTSVGTTPGYGSGHPLWLEIEAPKGTHAAFVEGKSSNNGEREMLLAAGQSYRILGVEDKNGKTYVRVRIVTESV